MKIFELFGDILLNDKASSQIDDVSKKGKVLGVEINENITKVAAFGTAAVAAGVAAGAAMLKLATDASDVASRINDMSAKMGISTRGFQEWDYVLKQSGVDIGVLQGGMKTLNNVIDAATQGGEDQVAMFKKLGVSLTDNKGKLKDTETIFNEVVTALQGMPEGANKAALSNDLLGKSSTEMSAIINGTSEDLVNMKNRANELGLVMSEEAVAAGDEFGDTLEDVKMSLGAIGREIGTTLMPKFQKMLDWIITNLPEIKKKIEDISGGFETFFKVLKDISPVLIGFGTSILLVTGYIKGMMIVTSLSTAFTLLSESLIYAGGAMGLLNVAMAANPIGAVTVAVGLLITAGVALYQNWDKVSYYMTTAFYKIVEVAAIFVGTTVKSLEFLQVGFLEIMKSIVGVVGLGIDTVLGLFSGMIEGINKALGTNFTLPSFEKMGKGLVDIFENSTKTTSKVITDFTDGVVRDFNKKQEILDKSYNDNLKDKSDKAKTTSTETSDALKKDGDTTAASIIKAGNGVADSISKNAKTITFVSFEAAQEAKKYAENAYAEIARMTDAHTEKRKLVADQRAQIYKDSVRAEVIAEESGQQDIVDIVQDTTNKISQIDAATVKEYTDKRNLIAGDLVKIWDQMNTEDENHTKQVIGNMTKIHQGMKRYQEEVKQALAEQNLMDEQVYKDRTDRLNKYVDEASKGFSDIVRIGLTAEEKISMMFKNIDSGAADLSAIINSLSKFSIEDYAEMNRQNYERTYGGKTTTLNQNITINSPKSLSASEIARQTKNATKTVYMT